LAASTLRAMRATGALRGSGSVAASRPEIAELTPLD
jgi:hypothetical protein